MLINCPECSHQISDTVKICPNCGFKLPTKNGTKNKWINLLVLCVIPFLLFFISQFDGHEDKEYIYRFVSLAVCVVISIIFLFLKNNIPLSKRYTLYSYLVGVCYLIIAFTGIEFLYRYHDYWSYRFYSDSFKFTTFEGVYYIFPILLIIYIIWVYLTGASIPKRNKIGNGIIISVFILLNVLTYHCLPDIVNNHLVSELNYRQYGNVNPVDDYINVIDQAYERIESYTSITEFQNPQSVISNDKAKELIYRYQDYILSPSDKKKLTKAITRTIIAGYKKYSELSGEQIDDSLLDNITKTIELKIKLSDKLKNISGINNN